VHAFDQIDEGLADQRLAVLVCGHRVWRRLGRTNGKRSG